MFFNTFYNLVQQYRSWAWPLFRIINIYNEFLAFLSLPASQHRWRNLKENSTFLKDLVKKRTAQINLAIQNMWVIGSGFLTVADPTLSPWDSPIQWKSTWRAWRSTKMWSCALGFAPLKVLPQAIEPEVNFFLKQNAKFSIWVGGPSFSRILGSGHALPSSPPGVAPPLKVLPPGNRARSEPFP